MMAPERTLPPGAYIGEDGRVYRDRKKRIGVETDAGGVEREIHELIPHEVYLLDATDPQGVWRAQKTARARGLDFWHPQHGWLKEGRTPERERPEQLGTLAKPRRRVSTPIPPSEAPPVERVDDPVTGTKRSDKVGTR